MILKRDQIKLLFGSWMLGYISHSIRTSIVVACIIKNANIACFSNWRWAVAMCQPALTHLDSLTVLAEKLLQIGILKKMLRGNKLSHLAYQLSSSHPNCF